MKMEVPESGLARIPPPIRQPVVKDPEKLCSVTRKYMQIVTVIFIPLPVQDFFAQPKLL
jgi:hypothetical protein